MNRASSLAACLLALFPSVILAQEPTLHERKAAALSALGEEKLADEWRGLVRIQRWNDASGNFSAWARYLECSAGGDSVTLLKRVEREGRYTSEEEKVEIPVERLGEEERRRIARIAELEAEATRLSEPYFLEEAEQQAKVDEEIARIKESLGSRLARLNEDEIRWISEISVALQAIEEEYEWASPPFEQRVGTLADYFSKDPRGWLRLDKQELRRSSANLRDALKRAAAHDGRLFRYPRAKFIDMSDQEIAEYQADLYRGRAELERRLIPKNFFNTPEEKLEKLLQRDKRYRARCLTWGAYASVAAVAEESKSEVELAAIAGELVDDLQRPAFWTDEVQEAIDGDIGGLPFVKAGEEVVPIRYFLRYARHVALSKPPYLTRLPRLEGAPATPEVDAAEERKPEVAGPITKPEAEAMLPAGGGPPVVGGAPMVAGRPRREAASGGGKFGGEGGGGFGGGGGGFAGGGFGGFMGTPAPSVTPEAPKIADGTGELSRPVPPANGSLWDVARGSRILSHSKIWGGSDVQNMFGGKTGRASLAEYESDKTLFDYSPGGTVHFVEWELSKPEAIGRIVVELQHDPFPPRQRYARSIRVFAYDDRDGSRMQLLRFDPSYPYGDTAGNKTVTVEKSKKPECLNFTAKIDPVIAKRFRAEFVLDGEPSRKRYGVRVIELSAYTE